MIFINISIIYYVYLNICCLNVFNLNIVIFIKMSLKLKFVRLDCDKVVLVVLI